MKKFLPQTEKKFENFEKKNKTSFMQHLPKFKFFFEEPHSKVWNDLHDPGLGLGIHSASAISNIVGFGYDSRWKYFQRCTNQIQKEDMSENVAVQHGVENEPNARDDFIKKFPFIFFVCLDLFYTKNMNSSERLLMDLDSTAC